MFLTHLNRVNFPISIDRTSLFQILGGGVGGGGGWGGGWVVFLNFIQKFMEYYVSNQWRP